MNLVAFLYPNMTALDLIGAHEVLARLPGASVTRVAEIVGPIETDSGISLMADASIDDVASADMLLVPGSTNAWPQVRNEKVLAWMRQIDQTTDWTTSVCTGSLILAGAGILNGLKATTHWHEMGSLGELGAVPTKARVVESGKYVTAAGVSAGIDMALTLTANIAGEDFAKAIQLGIEYDPEPPFDAGTPDKAGPELTALLTQLMDAGSTK